MNLVGEMNNGYTEKKIIIFKMYKYTGALEEGRKTGKRWRM